MWYLLTAWCTYPRSETLVCKQLSLHQLHHLHPFATLFWRYQSDFKTKPHVHVTFCPLSKNCQLKNELTRYTHAQDVPHAEHMESCRLTWQIMVKRHADYGVVLFFAYPVHARSASEVNRVGVGAQVFHFRTTVFHPSVEHSTAFCISAFILWPADISEESAQV